MKKQPLQTMVKSYTIPERATKIYNLVVNVFDYNKSSDIITPLELVEKQVDQSISIKPDATYLVPGAGIGTYVSVLIAKGVKPSSIYAVEIDPAYYELGDGIFKRFGVNYIHTDFLTWQPNMKFDVIVGNPPYGKCSNLAVKFLNKSFELAPLVFYVLPRTFNSPSILNRVHPNLHLIENTEADNGTFGGTILTCVQKWERREETREKIKVITKHPDFCFVSKEESNLFIGRIGAAGGSVKDLGYDHYTCHHYFLQVTDLVKERLMMIEDTLKVLAKTGNVGTPSLSKHELISTYMERFG